MDFLPEGGEDSQPIGSYHDKTAASESHAGIQGESGLGGHQGRENSSELAQQFGVPNQITQWKGWLLKGVAGVFGRDKSEATASSTDLKTLHAKIGELKLEHDNWGIFNCVFGENCSAADTSLTEASQTRCGLEFVWTSATKDPLLWVSAS